MALTVVAGLSRPVVALSAASAAYLLWRAHARAGAAQSTESSDPRGLVDANPAEAVDAKTAGIALDLAAGRLLSTTPNLLELNLKKAGLTTLPPEIGTLKQLKKLDVSMSPLADFPDALGELSELRILFCLGCKFTSVPLVVGKLESLYMLSFKSNALEVIDADALAPTLQWLILTDNRLTALPARLPKGLRKVMLTNNKLEALPDAICDCADLELIRLADNKLTALPNGFLSMPKLSWIAFAGNPLLEPASGGGGGGGAAAALPQPRWVPAAELEVHEQIGAGGGGFVHRATWSPPDGAPPRPAALKIFRDAATVTDGDPSHEIEVGAVLSHPNVVAVLGASPAPRLGLVLELLDCSAGGTWRELGRPPNFDTCTRDTYAADAAFAAAAVLRTARGVAAALAHLHRSNTTHGDLYAHNTLVDKSGAAKVGDFGAAFGYDGLGAAAAPLVERLEVRAFGCLVEELLERMEPPPPAGVLLAAPLATLRTIVELCMAPDVAGRPSFDDICAALHLSSFDVRP